jgi:hypothetical protein
MSVDPDSVRLTEKGAMAAIEAMACYEAGESIEQIASHFDMPVDCLQMLIAVASAAGLWDE